MNNIKGKKIAIIGFGKEGVSAANYLGKDNQIAIFDDKPEKEIDPDMLKSLKTTNIDFHFEGNIPLNLKFDFTVRSPGVRPDHKTIQKLIKNGATLTSSTKIFFDLCPGKIIGVTGTKGKGTTSTLIHEMLKTEFGNVYLGGNIGTPHLDILPKLNEKSIVVLELSSFQLFDLDKSPQIAVVLMLTQEHLDWHKDINEYQKAKKSIVKYQTKEDFAVINQDFETSRSFADETKAKVFFVSTSQETNGVYLKNSSIISDVIGPEKIIDSRNILLPGDHNIQNALAAIAVAKVLNVKTQNIVNVLKSFKGLIHRLQLVRELGGVKFYNDSFATTPETTIAAIQAFKSPKILILGGSSKNSDFTNLGKKISSDGSIKTLLLIGVEAKRIKEGIDRAGGFGGKIVKGCKNMQEIVKSAKDDASSGDIVLLSPACASFDMFKNYQDRGEQFIKYVNELK